MFAKARRYSALMLAARITWPHLSVSLVMSLPNSAGEPASNMPTTSASRALILGSTRPALISLLSLSTIAAGVFLGAPKSNEPVTCLLGSPSQNVNADRDPFASSLAMLKRSQTPPENCYKEGSRETHWEDHDVHARARGAGPRRAYPGS